ncbi:MAG: GMP synthase, partial [Nitratireductor sp.]|nr:GMP synthase [Nitratireductor sp.]
KQWLVEFLELIFGRECTGTLQTGDEAKGQHPVGRRMVGRRGVA